MVEKVRGWYGAGRRPEEVATDNEGVLSGSGFARRREELGMGGLGLEDDRSVGGR